MRYLLLLIVFIVGNPFSGKCDTVDYLQAKYNGKDLKIGLQYNSVDTIIIPFKRVKANDSISIRYMRDTPCNDCLTILSIEGDYGGILAATGNGTGDWITFSVKELVKFHFAENRDRFVVYYLEAGRGANTHKVLICSILIE
ncbi:MAG: hypothetical protein JST82_02500 [Bacteroidetes bacterium]|nr:hypothetical protein [Bacteroidota bacterium]